jgi:hypothetical protein
MVAPVAEMAAMRRESQAASISAGSCSRARYQRREKPVQAVVRRESLKLPSTSRAIGA